MTRPSAVFTTSFPLFAVVVVACAQLAGMSSVKAEDVESSETKAALNALVKENGRLEQQLQDAEESKAGLQKNLAIATGEAEILKRQLMEMRLRLEAFGLQGRGSEGGIEQRLLKAVSALRTAEQQKSALATAVIALSDGLDKSRQLIPEIDAETRSMLDAALTQGRQALAAVDAESNNASVAEAAPSASSEGQVIATKDELALVVTSLGREGGVKVGMPYRVFREDREIGSIRIVDVRDRISGAVVQELSAGAEKIRVGDKLKIGADRRL
jgi:hypothetical protein